MKKILASLLMLSATFAASAQTVAIDKIQKAARQFIAIHESTGIADDIMQQPNHTYADGNGNPIMYVFNIDDYGFVIVGADR